MSPEPNLPKSIWVELTTDEARALRLASIFGGPDTPDPTLESARRKLHEAEHDALNAEADPVVEMPTSREARAAPSRASSTKGTD